MSSGPRRARASQEDFDEVVSAIYEAALGSVAWEAVLPRIVRFLGGERGAIGVRARGAESDLRILYNLDPEIFARFTSEFSAYDPWLEHFATRKRPGDLLHGGSEAVFTDVRATEVYESIFAPWGLDDLLATTIASRDDWLGFVSAYRSRSEGLFDAGDVSRAGLLAPHLVRAAAIHERIGALGEEAAAAETVLECLPYGVLLLDARGALIWANRTGERMLGSSSVLTLRAGAVRSRDPRLDSRLVAACAAVRPVAHCGEMRVRCRPPIGDDDAEAWLEIMLVPIGPRAGGATLSFTARRARVALVLAQPEGPSLLHADAVGEVLQLPPSLARLATAITSGRTVADYSADVGVTQGTTRQQLKDLFVRVGVSRQADLVRIVLRSVAALALPDSLSNL
jgi:PAS domain-containing protein